MFQKDQTTILRLEILVMVVRESPLKEISSRLRPEVRKVFKSRDRGWLGRKNSLSKSPRWQKLWCSLRCIIMHVSLKLMSAEGDWGVARMWEL